MKSLITLLTLLGGLQLQAQTFTDDLKVYCTGEVTLETDSPFFTPEHCPNGSIIINNQNYGCGRALPVPPSAGFKIKAKVTKLNTTCPSLKEKYGIDMWQKEFESTFFLKSPSLNNAELLANEFDGKKIKFYIDQTFQYSLKGLLPLYPLAIKETIYIQSKTDEGSFSFSIPVDSQKVYNIPAIENMSDQQKLDVLHKQYEYAQDRFQLGHTKYLSLPLEYLVKALLPHGESAKEEYVNLILAIFESVALTKYPPSFYFKFNVGGSSGVNLAKSIITSNILAGDNLAQVLIQYPGFLSSYEAKDLPLTKELIIKVFQAHFQGQGNIGSVNYQKQQKGQFKELAKQVLNPHYFSIFNSKPSLVTPELKELAKKIINQ